MKSRIPIDKRTRQQMKEAIFPQVWETMQINKCCDLLAVKRFFGLGSKRMDKFLKCLAETSAELDTWIEDDVYKQKVTEELKECDIEYDWLMSDNVRMSDCRRRGQTEITQGEAERIIDKANELKKFMERGNK